jgi:hypothetical protein
MNEFYARVMGEHVLVWCNLLPRIAEPLAVMILQLKLSSLVEINEARPKR